MWRYSLLPSVVYSESAKIDELFSRLMKFQEDQFNPFIDWLKEVYFFNSDGKIGLYINIMLTCSEYNPKNIGNYAKIVKETQRLFKICFHDINIKNYLLNILINPVYLTNSQCLFFVACFKEKIFDIDEFLVYFRSFFNTDYEIPTKWLNLLVWFGPLIESSNLSFFQDCVRQYVDIFKRLFASEQMKMKALEFDELHLKNQWNLVTQPELIGQNPNYLVNIIKNDNISEFENLHKLKKFKVNDKIPPSIVELNFLMQNSPTLIEVSALYNSVNCFQYLMRKKAKLNINDDEGLNVIHYAAAGGSSDILKILNDLHFSHFGAIHFAALFHKYEIFENFYSISPEYLDTPIDNYGTVLHMCAKSNNIKTIIFCLKNKANINSRNSISNKIFF